MLIKKIILVGLALLFVTITPVMATNLTYPSEYYASENMANHFISLIKGDRVGSYDNSAALGTKAIFYELRRQSFLIEKQNELLEEQNEFLKKQYTQSLVCTRHGINAVCIEYKWGVGTAR